MSNFAHQLRHGGTAMVASVASMVFGLIRIKLLAAFFGPIGVGQIGLISNFIELCATTISAGFAGALNRELPRAKDAETARQLSSIALFFAYGVGGLLIVPMVFLFIWLSPSMTPSILLISLIIDGICAASAARLLAGFYQGYQMSKALLLIKIFGGLSNLALVIALYSAGFENYILYAIATPLLIMVFSLIFGARKIDWKIRFAHLQNKDLTKKLLSIAGPIVLTTLMIPLTFYYVRSFTEINLGAKELGLIQPGLQLIALSATLFASFAGMTIVRWDQSRETGFAKNQMMLLAAAVAIPIFCALILFNAHGLLQLIIRILYTDEFAEAANTLPYFLSAEALRMGAFLLNQTFISKGYNWFTLIPRGACLISIIAALHIEGAGSIVDISKAYALGHVVFFIISAALFLFIQFRSRAQPA